MIQFICPPQHMVGAFVEIEPAEDTSNGSCLGKGALAPIPYRQPIA